MRTDLENFHATTSGQRPGRILCYASFVDDLQRRLVEHTGTTDLATHYGMARRTLVGPRQPADLPRLSRLRDVDGQQAIIATRHQQRSAHSQVARPAVQVQAAQRARLSGVAQLVAAERAIIRQ